MTLDKIISELDQFRDVVTEEEAKKTMREYYQLYKQSIIRNIEEYEQSAENISKWQAELKRTKGEQSLKFRKILDEVCISDLNNKIRLAKDELKKTISDESNMFTWIKTRNWAPADYVSPTIDDDFWPKMDKFINERIEAYEKRTGTKWKDYVRKTTNNENGENNANGITQLQ